MRAWVEINKENLKYNVSKLRELAKNRKLLAVVKANAYGLGAIEISKILEECGVNFFGVANLDEALELREESISNDILVLGASFLEDFEKAEKNNIQVSISSFEHLKFLKEKKSKLSIHLKIDTGMTRLGFSTKEIEKAIDYCIDKQLNLKGIFSHLSDTDLLTQTSKLFTLGQIEKFKKIVANKNIEYIHISNSAGITNFGEYIDGNLVRIGLGMYGFSGDKKDRRLKNVFTIKSKIAHIRKIDEDSFVSYGRLYKLSANETYAVLPIGYADGMKKYLANGGYVLINDIKCEIIGNICMDMTMIKIPKILEDKINIGDNVLVLDSNIIDSLNIDELCTWDIMTGIGKRVKRIFI